jgi:hypothetical protein
MTGTPWTKSQITKAIRRGAHSSALTPTAIAHFEEKIKQKVACSQAKLKCWRDIHNNPPAELKKSPISAIPHNSKPYQSILLLSFTLRLQDGTAIPLVKESTAKTGPKVSHLLLQIIHAFMEADDDIKVFMAKYDMKDGFWCLDCRDGEEYNFVYILPQPHNTTPEDDALLIIPTLLQMGWIESLAFFCAATVTSRDIIDDYANTPIGTLPAQKN